MGKQVNACAEMLDRAINDCELYLFGAGRIAECILADEKYKKCIKAIFDNDRNKWSGGGVLDPAELKRMDTAQIVVLISSDSYDEIEKQLKELGVIHIFHYKSLDFDVEKALLYEQLLAHNSALRTLCAQSHRFQYDYQWRSGEKTPEWFDHYLDMYSLWGQAGGNAFWLERGIFSLLALKSSGKVLELCCGDGFNAKFFYQYKAAEITAVDFDETAIDHAVKNNKAQNIHFKVADIRYDMPEGLYDNIIWDAAIEHFTQQEITDLMKKIKSRLNTRGTLSGYTIAKRKDGIKSLKQHEYEFVSKEDLFRFLVPWFKKVKVFETIYTNRHNLYFWCSDHEIPFELGWGAMIDQCVDS